MKEQPQSQSYSPGEREVIRQLLEHPIGDQMDWSYWKALVKLVGEAVGRTNFAEIEQICREHDIPMSLLAIPITNIGQSEKQIIVDPNQPGKECLYIVLPCNVRNVEYYAQMYHLDDYTSELNLQRLEQSGFSFDRGSDEARMEMAPLN